MKDDLIARLEAAEGPTFLLMDEAFDLCFPKPAKIWAVEYTDWTEEYSQWSAKASGFYAFLDVGAWENAAMMLVPEGYFWSLTMRGNLRGGFHACCVQGGPLTWHFAATPALALTAASLRARSENPA